MSTKTSHIDSSVAVSDQELQSTLHSFLEENEQKPTPGIWNIRTITGLAMIFAAFAYVGHTVATELIGFTSSPFMVGLIQFMPYVGGALLAITLLTMFKKSGQKKKIEQAVEDEQVQQTYDKLDQFLYSDKERKKQTRTKRKTDYSVTSENKLMKSRTDTKIAGVCGGLAKYLGMNSTIVRILFVVAFLMSSGTAVLAYIAMSIVMPKEPVTLMDDFN
ncbi:PspC domain-containing protein [Rhodohalobacter halophilus]|uniref:PspC domain-containing protein n=1 Tax=Rhodohalobacter halophilus TaxID=1812810 RepID=UPI001FDFBED2|nr:PspC domain-containing protein [Rhodohalobacter halophilus]